MKKQLIVIGIIVILLTVGLSGCNESSDSNDENNTDTADNEEPNDNEYSWVKVASFSGNSPAGHFDKITDVFTVTGTKFRVDIEIDVNPEHHEYGDEYSARFYMLVHPEGKPAFWTYNKRIDSGNYQIPHINESEICYKGNKYKDLDIYYCDINGKYLDEWKVEIFDWVEN
jgi:hypothetical protein